jgi:hypothetical protein
LVELEQVLPEWTHPVLKKMATSRPKLLRSMSPLSPREINQILAALLSKDFKPAKSFDLIEVYNDMLKKEVLLDLLCARFGPTLLGLMLKLWQNGSRYTLDQQLQLARVIPELFEEGPESSSNSSGAMEAQALLQSLNLVSTQYREPLGWQAWIPRLDAKHEPYIPKRCQATPCDATCLNYHTHASVLSSGTPSEQQPRAITCEVLHRLVRVKLPDETGLPDEIRVAFLHLCTHA